MIGKASPSTLIVYGNPPPVTDQVTGQTLFDGSITPNNHHSFERLLVRELGKLTDQNLKGSTVHRLDSVGQLRRLLKGHAYTSVIFYGHTADHLAGGFVQGSQNLSLFGKHSQVRPQEWANTLKQAGIRQTIIAGCSSVAFAAGVFNAAPLIRVGGLSFERSDLIIGNKVHISVFDIRKQPIKWWSGPGWKP